VAPASKLSRCPGQSEARSQAMSLRTWAQYRERIRASAVTGQALRESAGPQQASIPRPEPQGQGDGEVTGSVHGAGQHPADMGEWPTRLPGPSIEGSLDAGKIGF